MLMSVMVVMFVNLLKLDSVSFEMCDVMLSFVRVVRVVVICGIGNAINNSTSFLSSMSTGNCKKQIQEAIQDGKKDYLESFKERLLLGLFPKK